MTRSGGQSPAEHHLGDRLAALVDGELGHDARERVLAHLATCCRCKQEADAQRRLKSVFAETAPPPPSEGLLARLQGLPGMSSDGDDNPFGGSGAPGLGGSPDVRDMTDVRDVREVPGIGGVRKADEETFALFAAAQGAAGRGRGFRIHQVERPAPPRRRFAFAAAGAVSLAAFALGAALPLDAAVDSPGSNQAEGTDAAVTPVSAAAFEGGARTMGVRESVRRDVGLVSVAETRSAGATDPAYVSAAPVPSATTHPQDLVGTSSSAVVPPLMRPVFAATRLLQSGLPVPPAAPAPTQMEGPAQPTSRSTPFLGIQSARSAE